MSGKNNRSNDWLQEARLLAESIETDWNVSVSTNLLVGKVIGDKKAMVCHATASFNHPRPGIPNKVTALVSVDRTFLNAVDRSHYIALHNLWIQLEELTGARATPPPR